MLERLLLAILLGAVLELMVLIRVAHATSWPIALGGLFLSTVAGVLLLFHQSTRTVQRLADVLQSGQPPKSNLSGGLFTFAAALLLIVPGYVSDVLALLLLLPPVRRWLQVKVPASSQVWVTSRGTSRDEPPPTAGQLPPGDRIIDVEVINRDRSN